MMHFSCSVDFNVLQEKTSGFLAYRVSSQRSFQVMSQNQNQRYHNSHSEPRKTSQGTNENSKPKQVNCLQPGKTQVILSLLV